MKGIPPSRKSFGRSKFNFVIDERLSDIINHFKIKKGKIVTKTSDKYITISKNDNIKLDHNVKNFFFIDLTQNDINFINMEIGKKGKSDKAHKDGEFEITTRQEEIVI